MVAEVIVWSYFPVRIRLRDDISARYFGPRAPFIKFAAEKTLLDL